MLQRIQWSWRANLTMWHTWTKKKKKIWSYTCYVHWWVISYLYEFSRFSSKTFSQKLIPKTGSIFNHVRTCTKLSWYFISRKLTFKWIFWKSRILRFTKFWISETLYGYGNCLYLHVKHQCRTLRVFEIAFLQNYGTGYFSWHSQTLL